jgi:hypothetical protein
MTGPWHPTGRGRVSQSRPSALAICDRCSFTYNHTDLRWQYEWEGVKLQNLRLLVCRTCLDKPQAQLKTIIIPPDPLPVFNARPENYATTIPNDIATESATFSGDDLTTETGDNLIWEDQTTPLPDPNNPALYPP